MSGEVRLVVRPLMSVSAREPMSLLRVTLLPTLSRVEAPPVARLEVVPPLLIVVEVL